MSAVNELFSHIRFLKLYGWERHWRDGAIKVRETELAWRVKENILNTVISFIWLASSRVSNFYESELRVTGHGCQMQRHSLLFCAIR